MFLLVTSLLLLPTLICYSYESPNLDLGFGAQGHLVGVREWTHDIKLGIWNGSVNKKIEELEYNEVE